MKDTLRKILRAALLLAAVLGLRCGAAFAQNIHLESSATIAEGVHLSYDIKADPEEPKSLILCGTKWDALTNSPYGFVYASFDSGLTWESVLEDRSSLWVTEQSCAFGPKHRAYFISEASKVFDGQQHHGLGTTRLFVSDDSGKHWTETTKTGWADFSTSAVSSTTDRLYTFFNDPSPSDPGRNRGSSVGLLVFSPDGKQVAGSFFLAEMRDGDYRDAYPSHAVALKTGEVSTLYYGVRQTSLGLEGEVGFIRATTSSQPLLARTVIAHGTFENTCLSIANDALAYDRKRNRLFVLYLEGCKSPRMMLTSSDDEGRTWTRSAVVGQDGDGITAMYPSIVVLKDGTLGFLWSEWTGTSGRWLFAQIRGDRFVDPPIQLSQEELNLTVNDESLWTTFHRPLALGNGPGALAAGSSITIGVRSLADVLWGNPGLIAMGQDILAVWSSSGPQGMKLNSGVLGVVGSDTAAKAFVTSDQPSRLDLTQYSVILYGGRQSFDRTTGKLTVCLTLANRGSEPIGLPVKLEVTGLRSVADTAAILNATNGLQGVGAIWDLSDSVTGDRLAPNTTTNPFCLSIRVQALSANGWKLDENIVSLDVRVTGPVARSAAREAKP
jgi:hypothetical protein